MATGVWMRVVGWAGLGKGELAHWASVSTTCSQWQLLAETPVLLGLGPLPGSRCLRTVTLHRPWLWDPEPAGQGLMAPPPWWDLSPTLAMRLHFLASLSGGGLAWRAGDPRWLAGEGRDWRAWGRPGLGGGLPLTHPGAVELMACMGAQVRACCSCPSSGHCHP